MRRTDVDLKRVYGLAVEFVLVRILLFNLYPRFIFARPTPNVERRGVEFSR